MRGSLTAGVALAALVLAAGPLRAGVYSTAEPTLYPLPGSFAEFHRYLGDLRGAASQDTTGRGGLRDRYLAQVAALKARGQAGELTVEDRVNLSAYYIRLLKIEEAVQALGPAEARDPDNFMVLANLATANHLAGRIDRAIVYQQQVLKNWPVVWVGFSWEQLSAYRQVEELYLKLLQLRQQEERLQPGRPLETVDALFPEAHFVGADGRYHVGPLPEDAPGDKQWSRIGFVSQLVWWLPFDDRLYWLLAELLNAQGGNIDAVSAIMDDLVSNRRFAPPELREHRRIIKPVADLWTGEKGPQTRLELLWELAPRQPAPGLGVLMNEASWAAALANLQGAGALDLGPQTAQQEKTGPRMKMQAADGAPEDTPKASGETAQPVPARSASWLPDWRPFFVGLGCGVVLTLLLGLQFRQARRRAESGAG